MLRRIVLLLIPVLAFLLLGSALAVEGNQGVDEVLAERLASPDATVVNTAVDDIQKRLQSDPDRSIDLLRQLWLQPLQDAERFDLVERLSHCAILAGADRINDVEFFQEIRVRALLAADKPQEALSQAKALFNVSGMRNTEKVLGLLAQCLRAAHPENQKLLVQLAREQKLGAATRPASDSPSTGGLLVSIRIDAVVYQAAIQRTSKDDYRSQVAKGNLLLLAGRTQEAKALFEKMAQHSGYLDCHENVARAIRAEDGTIGRANGYLLALPEPKERDNDQF